ncbi:arg-6 protein [Metarhizium guizhouense ARSEF 977]|uniref:Arg-6 protein n=1 Tax=Metarhizium guizhouense (strain ARSEF 977) TaxID=1276136 RepID=A0A0B4HJ87_METGA|nr:arg-6 protein [Metarhizium guizhouense ARSEF 977]
MNVAENVFPAIKKDYPSFAWTVRESDENLIWLFEKPDGSFNNNGSVLFYYGCHLRSDALAPVYDEFISHGRAMLWSSNLESRLRRASQAASESLGRTHVTQQARGYCTKARPFQGVGQPTIFDDLMPYGLTDHKDEREISSQLNTHVAFMPHAASWFRGIHHTINMPLNETMTSRDIRQIYQDRYAGEKLVVVVGEVPLLKNVMNKHGVELVRSPFIAR